MSYAQVFLLKANAKGYYDNSFKLIVIIARDKREAIELSGEDPEYVEFLDYCSIDQVGNRMIHEVEIL